MRSREHDPAGEHHPAGPGTGRGRRGAHRAFARTAAGLAVAVLLAGLGCGAGSGSSVFASDEGDTGSSPDPGFTTPQPELPVSSTPPRSFEVGAYYYNWWTPGKWDEGVNGEPRIGTYRGDDPDVAGVHITDAADAGVDVFAVNWYAGDSDRAMREGLLRAVNLNRIKFCIHYDIAIRYNLADLSLDLSKPVPRLAFIRDLTYVAENYFGHPQYYRINGRPVVMIYVSRRLVGDLASVFDQVRSAIAELGFDAYIVGDEITPNEPDPNRLQLFDAVTAYNLYNRSAVAEQRLDTTLEWVDYTRSIYSRWSDVAAEVLVRNRPATVDFLPGVIPQYNDTNVRADNPPIRAQSTTDFQSMLEMARGEARSAFGSSTGVIWVNSWNEWHEGSSIEPSIAGTGVPVNGHYEFGFLDAIEAVFPN